MGGGGGGLEVGGALATKPVVLIKVPFNLTHYLSLLKLS